MIIFSKKSAIWNYCAPYQFVFQAEKRMKKFILIRSSGFPAVDITKTGIWA